jgi:hypothetical protein
MNKDEAMSQIQHINKIFRSGDFLSMSGKTLILNGILILLIPALEWLLALLPWVNGHATQGWQNNMGLGIHVLVYWLLFAGMNTWFKRRSIKLGAPLHPFVKRAIKPVHFIVGIIVAQVIVLTSIGQSQLAFPVAYLLIAVLFQLLGQFTLRAMRISSWILVILGIGYMFLTQYHYANLWILFTTCMGLIYIVLGIIFQRHNQTKV